jgi:hypothetical protein
MSGKYFHLKKKRGEYNFPIEYLDFLSSQTSLSLPVKSSMNSLELFYFPITNDCDDDDDDDDDDGKFDR